MGDAPYEPRWDRTRFVCHCDRETGRGGPYIREEDSKDAASGDRAGTAARKGG
jgi:hypothetical protein